LFVFGEADSAVGILKGRNDVRLCFMELLGACDDIYLPCSLEDQDKYLSLGGWIRSDHEGLVS
jgi:hypothetical protein